MIASELLSQPNLVPTLASQDGNPSPVVPGPHLENIMKRLTFDQHDRVDAEKIGAALRDLGFRLDDSEVKRLLEQLDTSGSGKVGRSAFAASQV